MERIDATLSARLRQHRGNHNPPGGNYRGFVFRKLTGAVVYTNTKT